MNIHLFADGRATMSVRGIWYVRHRSQWACARRNDLGKALYVTVALDAVQQTSTPFQGSLTCPFNADPLEIVLTP